MISIARGMFTLAMLVALVSCGTTTESAVPPSHEMSEVDLSIVPNTEKLYIANGTNLELKRSLIELGTTQQKVIDGISYKYPNLVKIIGEYTKKMYELRAQSQNGLVDPVAYQAIKKALKGEFEKNDYLDITEFGAESSFKAFSVYDPKLEDSAGALLRIAQFFNEVMPDEITAETRALIYYSFGMYYQRIFDLSESNRMFSFCEDVIIQMEDTKDKVLAPSIAMYKAINNFYLKNYNTSVMIFENAPEYTDIKSDWFIYNKLNLYFSYLYSDPRKAQKMMDQFRSQDLPKDIVDSWPYQLLMVIDTANPSQILDEVISDEALTDREKAERLCEAYYYLGLKYNHMGAKNTARVFFILAQAQNVVEFLEHEFSVLALHYFFNTSFTPRS